MNHVLKIDIWIVVCTGYMNLFEFHCHIKSMRWLSLPIIWRFKANQTFLKNSNDISYFQISKRRPVVDFIVGASLDESLPHPIVDCVL